MLVTRRGQGLEIDHKEIARRNTQALVTVKTDYYLATPSILKPLDSGPWVMVVLRVTDHTRRFVRDHG